MQKITHNIMVDSWQKLVEKFTIENPKSLCNWLDTHSVMPGGNTRTVLHYDPFPVTVVKGKGSHLYDLDGHEYIDFLGEYSAGLYGHNNPKILNVIKETMDSGLVLGGPNIWESKLASEICSRFTSIEKVRFTNSGTEGNLMAIGAARAYTGRNDIMIFEGCYHGGVLNFKNDSSAIDAPYSFIKGIYNDVESTIALIRENKTKLAAILLEPMLGGGGCIPASLEFLRIIREETTKCGICLIFDEVMTSRSSSGGLQKRLKIYPDITTLGKYIGGGLSFGAFGGRSDIMANFDPTDLNSLRHAGTFNNNVLSMAAGFIGLKEVFSSEVAEALYQKGENFKLKLNQIIRKKKVSMQVTGVGSILGIHCHSNKLSKPTAYDKFHLDKLKILHLEMMLGGFYFAQRGYITLNIETTDRDLDNFLEKFEKVISDNQHLLE